MKLNKIVAASTAMIFGALMSTAASAKVFTQDYHDAGVWSNYDQTNEVYGMKFKNDGSKDGFWLVVSDGPNPKGNANEYAILYGDLNANKITAYTYDGANGPNSYQTGTFLGSYDGAFQDGGAHQFGYNTTMFTIDVAAINSAFDTPEWDGVQQGMTNGIWFHQSENSDFTYNADGSLLNYAFTDQMWLDRANDTGSMRASPDCAAGQRSPNFLDSCGGTTFNAANSGGGSVPAPGGLALLLVGLVGLRMRKQA